MNIISLTAHGIPPVQSNTWLMLFYVHLNGDFVKGYTEFSWSMTFVLKRIICKTFFETFVVVFNLSNLFHLTHRPSEHVFWIHCWIPFRLVRVEIIYSLEHSLPCRHMLNYCIAMKEDGEILLLLNVGAGMVFSGPVWSTGSSERMGWNYFSLAVCTFMLLGNTHVYSLCSVWSRDCWFATERDGGRTSVKYNKWILLRNYIAENYFKLETESILSLFRRGRGFVFRELNFSFPDRVMHFWGILRSDSLLLTFVFIQRGHLQTFNDAIR